MSEPIRYSHPERIGVLAKNPFYWCYRMHLGLDELAAATSFNVQLARQIASAGR